MTTTARSDARGVLMVVLVLSATASAAGQESRLKKNPYGDPAAAESPPTEPASETAEAPESQGEPVTQATAATPPDEAGSAEGAPPPPPEGASQPWLAEAVKRPLKVPAEFQGPEDDAQLKPLNEAMSVGQLSSESYVPSPRAQTSNDFLLPSGLVELGGELVFVTSRREFGGDRIDFTDVGLLRLRVRHALGERVELFGATHLLVKQPQAADEELWQGTFAGVRGPFGRWFAVEFSGSVGPLLEERGHWWRVGPGLLFKKDIEDYVRFQLGAGLAATGLAFRPRPAAPFWFEEIVTHAEVQFGEDDGGAWIGFDYRVPLAEGPDHATRAGSGERALDVGTTLSLSLGAVLPVEDTGWDLYTVFAVVDRGELDDPDTELPILDGGFDQTQLSAGIVRRLGPTDPEERERRRRERQRRRGKSSGPVVVWPP